SDLDVLEVWSRSERSGTAFMPIDVSTDPGIPPLDEPPSRGEEIVRELVSRGAAAIPHLVAHLDDGRPVLMRLLVECGSFRGGSNYGDASHVDRNRRTDPPFREPVEPHANAMGLNSGFHKVTVGDLCY